MAQTKGTQSRTPSLPLLPPGEKLPPLNTPADIWQLLGRFFGSLVMACITIAHILRQDWLSAATFGFLSLLLQIGTIILYQRLRKERREAEAALVAQYGGSGELRSEEETAAP